MITCKLIGGLGNQMMQIAFLYSFAKKHGLEYVVPLKVENPHIPNTGAYVFPGINYSDQIPEFPIWKEPNFHFADIPKMDNVCFYGFFQSYKYFSDYIDELRRAFALEDISINSVPNLCAIHVRRGDYVLYPDSHPPVSDQYLLRAIKFMYYGEGYKRFVFFSDGIDWCAEFVERNAIIENFSGITVIYRDGTDTLQDFWEMTKYNGMIGSNSTYSLMAAIMKKHQDTAIFPKKWFGSSLQHDTKDLIPPQFITM